MKDDELDRIVRDSFSDEDRALLEKYTDDQSIFAMVGDLFRTRHRWLTIYAFIWTFVFLGLAIWCAVRFFGTDPGDTRDLILWSVGFVFSMMVTSLLKLWFWLDMQRNAITREIKRLELAIARMD